LLERPLKEIYKLKNLPYRIQKSYQKTFFETLDNFKIDLSTAQKILITKKPQSASLKNHTLINSIFCGYEKII
jgi:hypothetical protein